MFQNLISAGLSAIRAATGVTVTYARGGASLPGLVAGIGSTEVQQEDRDGQLVVFRQRDWLIGVADLVLSGAATLPQAGDRITDAQGHTYEVANQTHERCWHYGDAGRTQFRVHSKEVNGP